MLAAAVPAWAGIDKDYWHRPRQLNLLRRETGERAQALYWADGKLQYQGYAEACWILRDVSTSLSVQMEPRLLDILFGVQGYVSAITGRDDWLVVTDGYRTPGTNRRYREKGLPAARESWHVRAGAADLDVAALSAAQLGKAATHLQGGGVGIYTSGHVHVDVGRIREWRN